MMTSLAEQRVVGLGEILWDCFSDSRRPGGAPANVAFHARQLGHRGVICSRVGDDEPGRDLLEYLSANGIETRYVQRDDKRPTGRVTVDTADPERPSYVIHENVAWDGLEFNDDVETLMRSASAVCFGTLAQRDSRSRETIHRSLAVASQALIVYDVNLRGSCYERDWIERSMQASRIVKLNVEELRMLADLLETGEAEPPAFAEELRQRFGVETTCITRADEGCLLIGPGETVDIPGMSIDVVDSVGAGDAFTAALISGRLRGWPLTLAAKFANGIGAMVAGHAGAMPILGADFKKLVSQMEGGGDHCRSI